MFVTKVGYELLPCSCVVGPEVLRIEKDVPVATSLKSLSGLGIFFAVIIYHQELGRLSGSYV